VCLQAFVSHIIVSRHWYISSRISLPGGFLQRAPSGPALEPSLGDSLCVFYALFVEAISTEQRLPLTTFNQAASVAHVKMPCENATFLPLAWPTAGPTRPTSLHPAYSQKKTHKLT